MKEQLDKIMNHTKCNRLAIAEWQRKNEGS